MNPNPYTVTIWQSGKLAPHLSARRFEFGRAHWLGAALLATSAIVLTQFVAVLERDVDQSALQHATQRSREIAQARCEAGLPPELRGRCGTEFNGDVVAAQAAPEAPPVDTLHEQERDALATPVSLLTPAR